jgi:hypothetical protein
MAVLNYFFYVLYSFNLFKIHSHEVSFVFGSAESCRPRVYAQ